MALHIYLENNIILSETNKLVHAMHLMVIFYLSGIDVWSVISVLLMEQTDRQTDSKHRCYYSDAMRL